MIRRPPRSPLFPYPTLSRSPPDPPAKPLPGTECPVVADGDAVTDGDVARPTDSPITAHISTAAAIHPLNRFDSHRRTRCQLASVAVVTGADRPGDAGGADGTAPPPAEPTAS